MPSKVPLVFDLHCDTPQNIKRKKFGHVVPERLFHANYIGAIFAHFIEPTARFAFVDVVELLTSTLAYIRSVRNIRSIRSPGELDKKKTNIVLGVEGGHVFDIAFKQLETLYDLGVRVFTLTWNNSNKLAHSALDDDEKGLTRRGRAFIREFGNYGVVLDLSHASTKTVLDVCEIAENPVIASHSCVRALRPSFKRNIADQAIKAIAQRDGVIGINFSEYHLGGHSIADHVEYIKEKVGIQAAAIGSDFDGIDDAVISKPQGLRTLEKEFEERGYTKAEIEKVFSGNFLRVFKKIVNSK